MRLFHTSAMSYSYQNLNHQSPTKSSWDTLFKATDLDIQKTVEQKERNTYDRMSKKSTRPEALI